MDSTVLVQSVVSTLLLSGFIYAALRGRRGRTAGRRLRLGALSGVLFLASLLALVVSNSTSGRVADSGMFGFWFMLVVSTVLLLLALALPDKT